MGEEITSIGNFLLYTYNLNQVSHLISSRFSSLFHVLLVGWHIGGKLVISHHDPNNQMIDLYDRWCYKMGE